MSIFSGIPLLGDIIKGVSSYQQQKQKLRAVKDAGALQLEQTKIAAQIRQFSSDADSAGDLDRIALETNGWKDEFLMIVITLPAIMAFIPGMVPYVAAGFAALSEMPEYYQYMFAGVFIYVFGFKRMMLKAINAFIVVRVGRAALPQPAPRKTASPKRPPEVDDDEYDGD